MLKLSFILTTYNSASFLKRTLATIDAQDYPEIEVCIKDGGSTDGTIDVIEEYAQKGKYPLKWESKPDTGIYDAMNQGFALSTGDVIAFFNDMLIQQDAVSKMMRLIEAHPESIGAHADLVYANEEKVVRFWKMGPQKSIYCGWMPGHPTFYIRRDMYEKYGLYKTDYRISADYEMMIRILKHKENRLEYLPETIVRMYYGGTSNSSFGSYMDSLKEGHRALKENGIPFAFIADGFRTLRVLLQFVLKSDVEINKSSVVKNESTDR